MLTLQQKKLFEKCKDSEISLFSLKSRIDRIKRPKVSKSSEKFKNWLEKRFLSLKEDEQEPEVGACGDGRGGRPTKRQPI